jgi:hypothetical protein
MAFGGLANSISAAGGISGDISGESPALRHLGLFPPARFITSVNGVLTRFVVPCLEPVAIEFGEQFDYTQQRSTDRFLVPSGIEGAFPFAIDAVIKSPFRVTLEEAMAFYWRVKTWDLRWIQSWLQTEEEQILPPEYDWEQDVGVPDSEKNLVCAGVRSPVNIQADDFFPFVQCELFGLFGSNIQRRPILINADGEYFINIRTIAFADDLQAVIRAIRLEAPLSWRLEGDVYFDDDGEQGEFAGTSIFEIGPDKWWPYDPGDGLGPIYDEDTGEQLRPF